MRRFWAILLTCALSMSLIALHAAPASAANTAVEALVSPPGSTDAADQYRQFSGVSGSSTPSVGIEHSVSDGYRASIQVAEAYVETPAIGGVIDSVIIASGRNAVDAAAAVGLSAVHSAPILLTNPGHLYRAAADFIEAQSVSNVYIIGGRQSISQIVVDELNALTSVTSVVRLDGVDRHETSIAVAKEISNTAENGTGHYLDTGLDTVIVVNADASPADAIAAGALAYAMQLPLVLSPQNTLKSDVSAYFEEYEIEQVVVIGGPSAISHDLVSRITAAGIDSVIRIGGNNRYQTAIAIANVLAACSAFSLSSSSIALLNPDWPTISVIAAPLLGVGLGEHGAVVTPALFVDTDALPVETYRYLSVIPTTIDSEYVDIVFTAFGSTEVISDATVQEAINAATSSQPILATIEIVAGELTAEITFSAPIDQSDGVTGAGNPLNYRLNGYRLLDGDTVTVTNNVVTIDLSGDEVFGAEYILTIRDGRIAGAGRDGRRVAGAGFTVGGHSENPDIYNLTGSVIAPENGHEIRISVSDLRLSQENADFLLSQVRREGAPLRSEAVAVRQNFLIDDASSNGQVTSQTWNTSIVVCLFGLSKDDNLTRDKTCNTEVPKDGSLLQVGERITVLPGAVRGADGATSVIEFGGTVIVNRDAPELIGAVVGNPHVLLTSLDEGVLHTLDAYYWVNENDTTYLLLSTKPYTKYQGVAGNVWALEWEVLETNDTPEVIVNVSEFRETITISVGKQARYEDVVRALQASSEYGRYFDAESGVSGTDKDKVVADHIAANSDISFVKQEGIPNRKEFRIFSRRNFIGGITEVRIFINYYDVIRNFDFDAFVAANAGVDDGSVCGAGKLPPANNWYLIPEHTGLRRAFNIFVIALNCPEELPAVGDTLIFPAGVTTTYKVDAEGNPAASTATSHVLKPG